jgi:hypothetical protein
VYPSEEDIFQPTMWELGGLPILGKIGAVGLFVPVQGGHFSKDAKNLL